MSRWITTLLWMILLNLLMVAGAEAQNTGNTDRSGNGTSPVSLAVGNQTGQTVSVFWVDWNGVEQGYGTIAPGASFSSQTYNSQVWRFKVGNKTIHALRTSDSVQGRGVMSTVLTPDMLNNTPSQGGPDSGSSAPPAAPPASTSVGDTGSNLTSAEADELVQYHNKTRQEVGGGPVRWSPTLAKYAQEWADEIARSGNVRHQTPFRYGENLFNAHYSNREVAVIESAQSWYGEKQFYTPGTPFPADWGNFQAGHYTQMVWSGTNEIGAGKAVIQQGEFKGWLVVVCNYNPPGNMVGQKPY